MKGLFFVFEGMDGSGKSTQLKRLARWIKDRGWDVLVTKEPGGTEESEKIRRLLLEKKRRLPPLATLFLFLASRADHVDRVIRPALKEGKMVLCDRFTSSTIVYQYDGDRVCARPVLVRLEAISRQGLEADYVIFIRCSPNLAMKRLEKKRRLTRFDLESHHYHRRVARGYERLIQKNWIVVDGNHGVKEVHREIVQKVSSILTHTLTPY